MKKIRFITKGLLSLLIIGNLFSITFAKTSQEGWDIFNELIDDGRTDAEIRIAMDDLGYDANEYLGKQITSKYMYNGTTQLGRDILNKYKQNGWSDDEIKSALEDAGLDTSKYFPETNTINSYYSDLFHDYSSYTSRSCKTYRIEFIEQLNAYTSPDLLKKEYFINIDYLKRYIDSKNAQSTECYIAGGWISSSYTDLNNIDQYIAPNGKIYFINEENGNYTSNELNTSKSFQTIDELKKYIKERNPLVSMGTISSKNNIL